MLLLLLLLASRCLLGVKVLVLNLRLLLHLNRCFHQQVTITVGVLAARDVGHFRRI